jgi:hypothetical protein
MRCTSHAQDLCAKVSACARGGSASWSAACDHQAQLLRQEAISAGCTDAFDAYYTCAGASFTCTGVSPTFPGCDTQRSALDTCLSATPTATSCGALALVQSACTPDAGATDASLEGGIASPPCDLAHDCEALCVLGNVADACAPAPSEIDPITTCASTCPL